MAEREFCQGCNERHGCREIYRQLGNAKGRGVVLRVLAAFLLPLMVFVASLAVFEQILGKAVDAKGLQTLVSLVPALTVTFALILTIRVINRGFSVNNKKGKVQKRKPRPRILGCGL